MNITAYLCILGFQFSLFFHLLSCCIIFCTLFCCHHHILGLLPNIRQNILCCHNRVSRNPGNTGGHICHCLRRTHSFVTSKLSRTPSSHHSFVFHHLRRLPDIPSCGLSRFQHNIFRGNCLFPDVTSTFFGHVYGCTCYPGCFFLPPHLLPDPISLECSLSPSLPSPLLFGWLKRGSPSPADRFADSFRVCNLWLLLPFLLRSERRKRGSPLPADRFAGPFRVCNL
ncbi:hypothetical protein HanIR_Chr00c03g0904191 [Helianthus annuus]|nr:hypothetical protein HanIR_Chr00c03g0904191 [Helianthus annuus]